MTGGLQARGGGQSDIRLLVKLPETQTQFPGGAQ